MNSKEIIELLEQFGFESQIKDGNVSFIDTDTNEQACIELSRTDSVPLDGLNAGNYFAMRSSEKVTRMTFANPLIRGVRDQSQVMIKNIHIGDSNTDYDVEYSNFDRELHLQAIYDKKEYDITRIKIDLNPTNYIFVKVINGDNVRTGYYYFRTRKLDESSEMDELEILSIVTDDKAITTFIEYYGKIYPAFLEDMEVLRSSVRKSGR